MTTKKTITKIYAIIRIIKVISLSNKVERLGIGFSIDSMINAEIIEFIQTLTIEKIKNRVNMIKEIPKTECINDNKAFIEEILCS